MLAFPTLLRRAATSVPARALARASSTHAHAHAHGHGTHVHHVYSSPATITVPEGPLTDYVFERAASFGDRPALIDGTNGSTISYNEMLLRVGNVMKGLADRGMAEGDVVGIHMPNHPLYPIIFHAVAALGGVVTTSSPMYTHGELTHQLRDSKAKFVITVPMFKEVVVTSAKDAAVKDVFVLGEDSGRFILANDGKTRFTRTLAEINPAEHVVALPYSSGTTGLPKGVMLTHRNIAANVEQCTGHPTLNVDIRPGDVVMGILPYFHIYAMNMCLNSALRVGSTVVTMPKFDPVPFLETMAKHKVTFAPLVPPIIAFLARHPVVSKFDLSSLRVIFSGAAPLDAETQKAVELRLPGARSCQGYGMSEASPVTHIPDPKNVVAGSVGLPVPSTQCKVVDPHTGKELGPGPENVGELWVKGPQVMKGYLGKPQATAETIKDGWLMTGDIGWCDAEGQTRIVDRAKELIKVKGYQCAPAELEGLLVNHPAIGDAAVVGMPDARAGEVPVAFVVRRAAAPAAPGAPATPAPKELSADEVKEYLKPKVADYKVPAHVVFIDAIPKSPAGKILRRVLKADLAKHIKAE